MAEALAEVVVEEVAGTGRRRDRRAGGRGLPGSPWSRRSRSRSPRRSPSPSSTSRTSPEPVVEDFTEPSSPCRGLHRARRRAGGRGLRRARRRGDSGAGRRDRDRRRSPSSSGSRRPRCFRPSRSSSPSWTCRGVPSRRCTRSSRSPWRRSLRASPRRSFPSPWSSRSARRWSSSTSTRSTSRRSTTRRTTPRPTCSRSTMSRCPSGRRRPILCRGGLR